MVQDSKGNLLGYVETKWGSAGARATSFVAGVGELNLVEETDRGFLSTRWSILVTKYSGIPYNEESGFAVTLD